MSGHTRIGEMRTKNTFLNALANSGSYIVNLILSFVARTIFIRVLSQEYLGVQGLFGNILSVLSLAELGIGTAICMARSRAKMKKRSRS